jgi:hypothetical protein
MIVKSEMIVEAKVKRVKRALAAELPHMMGALTQFT